MAYGKFIKSYLLLLLLLLCSHNVEFNLPAAGNTSECSIHPILLHGKTAGMLVSVNRRSVSKDWIKVRYMGGECPYDVIAVPVIAIVPEFTDEVKVADHTSFICSRHSFLFKLRGPPTA